MFAMHDFFFIPLGCILLSRYRFISIKTALQYAVAHVLYEVNKIATFNQIKGVFINFD